MLVLNPRLVKFGPSTWENVVSVAIDRAAHKQVIEWSDAGPHAVMADVPEQRVTIKVMQELLREDIAAPRPGEQAELIVFISPAGDSARRKVAMQAVVLHVTHELSLKKGAVRTVELAAVSSAGSVDPITITDAGAGV